MIRLLLLALALLFLTHGVGEAGVTRYTTSTARGATGTTCSHASRCTNATAISLSTAGDTVSMEGNTIAAPYEYKGTDDMIVPPAGRSGNSLTPITVRCEVDGGCRINGEFARVPLKLVTNNWWVFEGFNVHSSSVSPIYLTGGASTNNRFIRMVAWDARMNANIHVVSLDKSSNNTFEDFAAFGTGRKVFSIYNGSNNTICRRCWFRAEGSTYSAGGPGPVASPWYLSTGSLFENVLVTWSMELLPHTYTNPQNGVTYTNHQTPAGMVLAPDRIESLTVPKLANSTIRGSIIYNKATDTLNGAGTGGLPGGPLMGVTLWGASNITLTDVLRVMAPSHTRFNAHMGFVLTRRPHNCPCTSPLGSAACQSESAGPCESIVTGNTATRLTSIRGEGKCYGTKCGDSFGTAGVPGFANETDWTVSNTSAGTCIPGTQGCLVQSPWQNTSANGARLCYRTVNGVVQTSTPLWPWPMNERIKQATTQAGAYSGPCTLNCKNADGTPFTFPARQITDVTEEIEALLGTIPASCRRSAGPQAPELTGLQ